MSIPRDHHFLPQFYTARWASEGSMVRYVRPRCLAPLHEKAVVPKSIGKARDLYAYSTGATEAERQRLEMRFFGPIDHRAAEALQKLDACQSGSTIDKVGLVQFVLSLQYRSPSRIAFMRDELANRMIGVRDFDAHKPEQQRMIADGINDLLLELISSKDLVRIMADMRVFRINVDSKHRLLTCDLPLMMSQGIAQSQGFLMFPYSPNRIAILVHDPKVAEAFSTQKPDVLAKAVNDALVRQAREFVIAADRCSRRFVENRFLKNPEPLTGDGIMRWQVP
ncbi:MAG: hypothetical protein DI568_13825 [Sphingomonas sp.]|nr:MAG: hypothetical protein DI568_13825 [Sphingomonas sp.]